MLVKFNDVEFQMDVEYEFLLRICSFWYDSGGYIVLSVNRQNIDLVEKFGYKLRQKIKLHRLIYMVHNNVMLTSDQLIDHIDRDKTNNKLVNLRVVSNSENSKNRGLRKDQIYYNICHNKYLNYFVFQHTEKNYRRLFTELRAAIDYFEKYDEENDHVLTKHITKKVPSDKIENVVLKPDGKCDKCGSVLWSKKNLKQHHQKKSCVDL